MCCIQLYLINSIIVRKYTNSLIKLTVKIRINTRYEALVILISATHVKVYDVPCSRRPSPPPPLLLNNNNLPLSSPSADITSKANM